MFKVGEYLVLHSTPVPALPQIKLDVFVEIRVVETRQVKGVYKPEETHAGFKATSKDGRKFFCCWNSYDETDGSPYTVWWEGSENAYENIWWDVTSVGILPGYPRGLLEDLVCDVVYCETHRKLFYNSKKCFYCEQGLPATAAPEPQALPWNGWF